MWYKSLSRCKKWLGHNLPALLISRAVGDPSDHGRNGGGRVVKREGREGGREKKKGAGPDLNLQAHSLIFPAISQLKGHHNYDGDKTMPAYVC